jgi:hypothetical protein
MKGGKIHGNKGKNTGGVSAGFFTMTGGEIYNNEATATGQNGGGVNVSNLSGSFTMSGGKIYNNETKSNGGGVYAMADNFTITGGEIYNNTAKTGGGVYYKVYAQLGAIIQTMTGGEIYGNTAKGGEGGGVYVLVNAKLKKTGGIVYGYEVGNAKSNKVTDAEGSLVNDKGHAFARAATVEGRVEINAIRNSTAGPGVTVDTTLEGPSGGWE